MTSRQMRKPLKGGIAVGLDIPTDLSPAAVAAISETLRQLLADVFALYMKTKNFHWHMSGPHFRDYHLLLAEQGSQDRRHNAALHRRHRPTSTIARQR